jgi:hypothetical protein
MVLHVASSRSLIGVALAVNLCLPAVPLSAQSAVPARAAGSKAQTSEMAPGSQRTPAGRAARPPQGSGTIRVRATAVQGSAWHADNTPIRQAAVRLRNVLTGKTEASTVADEAGHFAFRGVRAGTYLVELVDERGKVLTIGHVFTVAPGDTVATFVRLGPQVPWFTGLFGKAAVIVAASAATAGVAALSPAAVTAVSPNR